MKKVVETHKKTVASNKFLSTHIETILRRLKRNLTPSELVLVQHQLAQIPILYNYQEELRTKNNGKVLREFEIESTALMGQIMDFHNSEEKIVQLELQLEKAYVWAIIATIIDLQSDTQTHSHLKQLQTKLSGPLTFSLIFEIKQELKSNAYF